MQIVLYSPTLGTLDLTATATKSGRAFDTMLVDYDMGLTQPELSVIEGMFGDIQNQTGSTDRTPAFHVAVRADAEADRAAGGEAIGRWINADDCELRYIPTDGPMSCLLILSGYASHVAAPNDDNDKFKTEWLGNEFRWYEVHLITAPQVLAADFTTASVSGSGVATGMVAVEGTFPAAATISATAGTALGKTIIYTGPTQYAPGLRARLTVAGSTLTRSSAPHFYKGADSDAWPQLDGAIFGIPATDLPAGDYAFVAHVYNANASAQTLLSTMTVTTFVGGQQIDTVAAGSMGVTVAGSTEALISLGSVTIDRAGISDGAESSSTVNVAASDLPGDLYVDELFALRIDPRSSLTMVDAGSGTVALGVAHSLLSVAASPRPDQVLVLRRGLASDATKTVGPGADLAQMEPPMLPPGDNFVFVASAGVDTALTAVVTYRSAHTTYADAS